MGEVVVDVDGLVVVEAVLVVVVLRREEGMGALGEDMFGIGSKLCLWRGC